MIRAVMLFAGTFTPEGWVDCDGSLLSVDNYFELFKLLGTTYGGDGDTTFALPDLRGRVVLGAGQGPQLTNRPQGVSGGAEQVTLTTDDLPAHNHAATSALRGANVTALTSFPAGSYLAMPQEERIYADDTALVEMGSQSVATTIAETGQNQAHANMMPFLSLRYIIATDGIYPTHPS